MLPARVLLAPVLFALAGCGLFGDDEPPLPGERVPVRVAVAEATIPAARAAELAALGQPAANADWSQPNALSTRAPGHLVGPASLREAWRTDVGRGSGGSARITSSPVVAGGSVFTLDAGARVTALDAASGRVRWTASVSPPRQSDASGFGGGLAVMDGRVFAGTGFGEVVALSAADGAELWRQALGAPIRAAPAVADGRVVVVTRDNAGFGLDAQSGAVLWRALGAAGTAGLLGGASPAISGELAVLPFTSGEIVGVRADSGRRLWSDALASGRRGFADVGIADVSGDPVIAGAAVFASNFAGQMVAVDGRNGLRGWLRALGSSSPVWSVGPTLFVVTNDARVMRLAGATGETIWSTDLPDPGDPATRAGRTAFRGPVVASGVVYVTSSRDGLLSFDAVTGEARERVSIPGGSSVGPVVAGGTLYVLSDNGVLHAFR
jgi:outer membrane protein assembly factor BamB